MEDHKRYALVAKDVFYLDEKCGAEMNTRSCIFLTENNNSIILLFKGRQRTIAL